MSVPSFNSFSTARQRLPLKKPNKMSTVRFDDNQTHVQMNTKSLEYTNRSCLQRRNESGINVAKAALMLCS